jgi:hypothetical protein
MSKRQNVFGLTQVGLATQKKCKINSHYPEFERFSRIFTIMKFVAVYDKDIASVDSHILPAASYKSMSFREKEKL